MMKRILASVTVSAFPLLALAQVNTTYSGNTGLGGLLKWFSGILSLGVPLIISLAVVYFIWNVFNFFIKEGEAKDEAKSGIVWGIVAIFIMVSVWGLVNILSSTFQLGNGPASGPAIPVLQ